jgi:uncharacterized protein YpmS
MDYHKNIMVCILASVMLITLSCTIFIGGPSYPDQVVPVSDDAVSTLQSSLDLALTQGASTELVTFSIDESQMTSYLEMKLGLEADPFLTDPQVYLRDGTIQIYGTATQGYFQATALIVLTAGVDEEGSLSIEFTSADFGPLPIPDGLTAIITSMIQEAFTGTIGPVATGIRITNLVVADGVMTITGDVK